MSNQQIQLPILEEKQIQLCIKREDLLHPLISGNKFRKLKYNVLEAKKQGCDTLVTFGGAFSNHILATAAAGNENGLKTVGIIRGEELGVDLGKTLDQNETLQKAAQLGMQFEFVSRSDYREKKSLQKQFERKYPNAFFIPEGGTNTLAIQGCEEILTEEDKEKFDYIFCPIGTGGTIVGLINASSEQQKVIGIAALKGDWLKDEVQYLQPNKANWEVNPNYHFGGYAKYNQELIAFINQFKEETGIPLDPIYTGKMLFGVMDMIQNDNFEKGTKILMIHTGGLQGIRGVNQQLKNKGWELIN